MPDDTGKGRPPYRHFALRTPALMHAMFAIEPKYRWQSLTLTRREENYMLGYSIMMPEGILILRPDAPLGKGDFDGLSAAVDAYLEDHNTLRGVLILAKVFPGWEDFGGFTAHMHFVREHQKKVRRVAVVTDNIFGGLVESLGKHFASAEIKHFRYSDDVKALDWLKAG